MSQTISLLKFIFQSIVAGLAIGFLILYFKGDITSNSKDKETSTHAANAVTSYAPAVKKISPSVVSIYAQSEVRPRQIVEESNFMGLSSLNPQTFTQQYLGSGVVVSDDGYIVTNFHVIKNATKIIISLFDDSLLEAKVIGSDRLTDIAILKIEALNLVPAQFANSDNMQTGDIVLAIGNPYGLSQSVSLGIISAKGRSGLNVSAITNFIQTDAAINEGNSGGALMNVDGEVVGISTASFNQNGAQGINFAIPSNDTKLIIEQILKYGKVLRGWLGIGLFTPQLYYLKRIIKPKQGVMIFGVYKNSPAYTAGLDRYDIITHINDEAVKDQRHYQEIILKTLPGQLMKITGYSKGKPFTQVIETIDRPIQFN